MSTLSVSRKQLILEILGKAKIPCNLKRHLSPRTVGTIMRSLPLEGHAHLLGQSILYFETSIDSGIERARTEFKKGDVAMQTINEALEINEKDPEHIKQKSILLFETDKREEATALLKTIDGYDSQPKITIPLAALLRENGQFEETINLLKEFHKNTDDKDAILESSRMLIDLYIQVKQYDEAIKLVDNLIENDPNNISYYVDKSHIYHALNKIDVATLYLEQAKEKITDKISNRQRIELGSAFYVLGKYHDSANVLENVADTTVDSEITRKLLNSYYRSGKLREALDVIKSLRVSKERNKYLTEMESSIYEDISDWDNAKKACKTYLETCPDDKEIQIRYAVVLYRSGSKSDLEELDVFLDGSIETSKLSFDFWMQLISLYESRNQADRALRHSYEVRRKFFDKPEAHLQYIGLFFRTEKTNEKSFNHKEVQLDSSVFMEDEGSI
ncbi:MAG: tetratricopeptide repeat protein, partial [Thaumarchaeota archaeon]|nr:tetratricopeptide repeat protein [Nitrososphaerota archaeon]